LPSQEIRTPLPVIKAVGDDIDIILAVGKQRSIEIKRPRSSSDAVKTRPRNTMDIEAFMRFGAEVRTETNLKPSNSLQALIESLKFNPLNKLLGSKNNHSKENNVNLEVTEAKPSNKAMPLKNNHSGSESPNLTVGTGQLAPKLLSRLAMAGVRSAPNLPLPPLESLPSSFFPNVLPKSAEDIDQLLALGPQKTKKQQQNRIVDEGDIDKLILLGSTEFVNKDATTTPMTDVAIDFPNENEFHEKIDLTEMFPLQARTGELSPVGMSLSSAIDLTDPEHPTFRTMWDNLVIDVDRPVPSSYLPSTLKSASEDIDHLVSVGVKKDEIIADVPLSREDIDDVLTVGHQNFPSQTTISDKTISPKSTSHKSVSINTSQNIATKIMDEMSPSSTGSHSVSDRLRNLRGRIRSASAPPRPDEFIQNLIKGTNPISSTNSHRKDSFKRSIEYSKNTIIESQHSIKPRIEDIDVIIKMGGDGEPMKPASNMTSNSDIDGLIDVAHDSSTTFKNETSPPSKPRSPHSKLKRHSLSSTIVTRPSQRRVSFVETFRDEILMRHDTEPNSIILHSRPVTYDIDQLIKMPHDRRRRPVHPESNNVVEYAVDQLSPSVLVHILDSDRSNSFEDPVVPVRTIEESLAERVQKNSMLFREDRTNSPVSVAPSDLNKNPLRITNDIKPIALHTFDIDKYVELGQSPEPLISHNDIDLTVKPDFDKIIEIGTNSPDMESQNNERTKSQIKTTFKIVESSTVASRPNSIIAAYSAEENFTASDISISPSDVPTPKASRFSKANDEGSADFPSNIQTSVDFGSNIVVNEEIHNPWRSVASLNGIVTETGTSSTNSGGAVKRSKSSVSDASRRLRGR